MVLHRGLGFGASRMPSLGTLFLDVRSLPDYDVHQRFFPAEVAISFLGALA
jgi:hypothetical protein